MHLNLPLLLEILGKTDLKQSQTDVVPVMLPEKLMLEGKAAQKLLWPGRIPAQHVAGGMFL